ncbi:kinesin [Purpureocillium lavendulum]|uniref:Kinesin n=1 Tax=Purpureocillium lavendulum TaxID=1247861 RepID=A0AB34G3G9_9HYPO|nr:kinesin [Purpureocillium lavendulum]
MVRDWPRDSFPRQQSFQQQCYPPTGRPSFQHERYGQDAVPRQDSFQQERYQIDGGDGSRFQDQYDLHRRAPPMQIDEALRSHCGIAAKQYFVAAINDDGLPITFFSPGQKLNDTAMRQFFDANKFQQVMRRIESGADPILEDGFGFEDSMYGRPDGFGRLRAIDRRRNSVFDDWGSPARQGRKRPRARHPVNDDDVPMTVSSRRGIKVGDSEAVWNFYEQRFKNCQQTACKLIAKAWVKAVEPKKQSTHPYTGSDEKAPDWWPKPWGPTKDDKVRHKEPDHLYKRERVHLLAHILRLVVEPNGKQHPDIQKLCLNVKKLEETTNEALSAFFMDNDANAKKRPYLNEIFKMARQEERFKNGEIDDSTEVYVMAEDKVPESYTSDNDDGSFNIKEEDEHDVQRSKASVAHPLAHTPTTAATNGHGLHGGPSPFMGDLPVRGTPFHPPMIQTDIAPQQHSFVESNGLPVSDQSTVSTGSGGLTIDLVTSPHDGSRRPSVFSEYASPGGGSMYHQPWQQGSTGPNSSSMYAYTAQQATSQQPAFVSQAVTLNAGQPFMTNSFESSPRPEYDANGNAIFRGGDMPPAPVGQPQGYYVPNDGRGSLRVMTQVVDAVPRNAV